MTEEPSKGRGRQELAIALQAAKSATAIVQSLIEATPQVEPKYANLCGSRKTPEQVFESVFETIFDLIVNRVLEVPEGDSEFKKEDPKWKTKWG